MTYNVFGGTLNPTLLYSSTRTRTSGPMTRKRTRTCKLVFEDPWRHGLSLPRGHNTDDASDSLNVDTLHHARLVLGWVTICGRVNNLCM